MLTVLLSIAVAAALTASPAHAATIVYPDTLSTPDHRYRIVPVMRPLRKTVGLALSGGGANGIAQIGVLKALEEQEIPVDHIAGTSMGALVGGLYSSGYTAKELESIVLSLPWQKLVSLDNETPRTSSYLEQKRIRDRATIVIRFEKFRLIIPRAVSAAQTLTRTIDLLVLNAPYHNGHSFSDLPVSFRAVTTDLVSGRRVTLTSGHLSEAMRASSTIPILHLPVERDELRLSDGGLVANLPVDELVAADAGYRIAVDTHGGMYTDRNDIDVPWKAADQAMTILTQVQYPRQLELADLVVTPEIGNHKATDFSDIPKLIEAGYAKGLALAPVIRNHIQIKRRTDIDITGYSRSVTGIPDSSTCLERTLGIVRRDNRVRTVMNGLLETGLFSRVHAEIDDTLKKVVFVLEPLPLIEHVEAAGGPTGAISQDDIDHEFRHVTGHRSYTAKEATTALENLIRLYRQKGYSLVEIESIQVSGSTLLISLSSGAIGEVLVEQNRNITRQLPIRREMTLDTNKVFRYADAQNTIDNLYGTGIFNRVSLSAETSAPDTLTRSTTLRVRLDEKPSTALRLGVRYDETLNAQLLIDFRNENINGSGNSLGGWAKTSQKNNRINLEFSIPRFGKTPLTMFTRAFFDQHDIETRQLVLSEHSGLIATGQPRSLGIQKYGFTTSFGTRIKKNDRLTADFTLQNSQSYLQDRIEEPFATGNVSMASIGGQFTFDSRDNPYLPSGGRNLNIRYSSTSILQKNREPFWQFVASLEENLSTASATTLQLTALAGTGSIDVPLSEKYFLGGSGNAYSYRFIGLKDNDLTGNNIAVVGALVRYRSPVQLAFPTSFILVYNIGNVWEKRSQMSISHMVQGAGAGLVWDTPIGPAQLTVAKPFAFEDNEVRDTAQIDFTETIVYFSLGHDF